MFNNGMIFLKKKAYLVHHLFLVRSFRDEHCNPIICVSFNKDMFLRLHVFKIFALKQDLFFRPKIVLVNYHFP